MALTEGPLGQCFTYRWTTTRPDLLDPAGDPTTASHSVSGPVGATIAFDRVDDEIALEPMIDSALMTDGGVVPQNLIEGMGFLADDTKVTREKEYTFAFPLGRTADLDAAYHLAITANPDDG